MLNIDRFYDSINIDYQVDMLQTALNHNMEQSQKLSCYHQDFLVLKVKLVFMRTCEHQIKHFRKLLYYFLLRIIQHIQLFTRCEYKRKVYRMIKYFAKTLCATIHIFVITVNGMKFIHIRKCGKYKYVCFYIFIVGLWVKTMV